MKFKIRTIKKGEHVQVLHTAYDYAEADAKFEELVASGLYTCVEMSIGTQSIRKEVA